MALQVQFRQGDPIFADYTPGSAVAAGDVVVVGDLACVAHNAIPASTLGAVAVGGGIYKCTGDAAIAAGVLVYWDDTNNKVTVTAASNKRFGFIAPGNSCSGNNATVDVVHSPASVA
jgi:predicted RecA/RadA family phage recombinase